VRVLLLSAYDAPSHRYWREGLAEAFSEYQFTCLTLPPRYFQWRVRGNPLSWWRAPALQEPYDLLIATSMVDLACLRGLLPHLAQIPSLYYFHENQFAYPPGASVSAQQQLAPQMVSIYGALAADLVVFNSQWNRSSFLVGVQALIKQLPDAVPEGLLEELTEKSSVLPVPVAVEGTAVAVPPVLPFHAGNPLHLLWNHRWEYDKGPEVLLAIIQSLPPGLPLCWSVVGQQFRRVPDAFLAIHSCLVQRNWLGAWGFIAAPEAYQQLLQQSHVVISTAWHDFQGLSVLDAVAQGALPLVPKRLAYPEWFGDEDYFYAGEDEVSAASEKIQALCSAQCWPRPPDITGLTWPQLKIQYADAFAAALDAHKK
jgi:glycosyltransferase involved in cell wall biosynthesis